MDYDCLTRDNLILELKKSEQDKIKYVNKYLEQEEKWNVLRLLFAKISHEFKTPLNAIIGFSELLKENLKTEKELGFISNVSNSATHLLDLITDILDLSKAQYDGLELNLTVFNTKSIIINILNTYHNVQFTYNIDDIYIKADIKRFRQLIYNLTSNAAKFCNNKPIQIKTSNHNDCFIFEITDYGDGIEEIDINIIFDFFSQTTNDTTKRQMGSGIGLALCKSIVDAHQGNIYVNSILGEYTTFTFSLPLLNG